MILKIAGPIRKEALNRVAKNLGTSVANQFRGIRPTGILNKADVAPLKNAWGKADQTKRLAMGYGPKHEVLGPNSVKYLDRKLNMTKGIA